MKPRKVLALAFPVILSLSALLIIAPGRGQEKGKQPSKVVQENDYSSFPIADYSAPDSADPNERIKRHAKGKKYNKSSWRVHPDSVSDRMVRVDEVDHSLPALPFDKSFAVVVGEVTEAQAYLSNHKSGVYSVFTIQVTEILKNSLETPLTPASSLEVERDGGQVRFPNGRLHLYIISEQDMPKVGQRYVLFLTNTNGEPNLEILTGYELREGKVYSLDNLPNTKKYKNAEAENFLKELREFANS
jgi:hypothetical protein